MTIDILKRLGFMVLLILVQVMVLNNIQLFDMATPLLLLLVPLYFDSEQSRWSALLWCFCFGLIVDIFSNTPGVNAGAMTLLGLVQPKIIRLFVTEEDECLHPSLKEMGWWKFLTYAVMLIFVFSLAFFTLEAFSFFNPLLWILKILTSTAFTLIMIVAIEKLRA